VKIITSRPRSGAEQKAWDYATCKFGKIKSLSFIVGCRQKGFWHCIMQDGSNQAFLHSVAMNWFYSMDPKDCK
jgi:hypothetical protein